MSSRVRAAQTHSSGPQSGPVSNIRAGTLPRKIGQVGVVCLLRLDKTCAAYPWLAKVGRELAALKAKHDAITKASVAAQHVREGKTVTKH